MHRLLGLLFLISLVAQAQWIDGTQLGDPIVLNGAWKFHAGDDARWADPDFDDSSWRTIEVTKSWDQQGLQNVRRYFWYRVRVRLSPKHKPLSFMLNQFGPYQVYLNGVNAGSFGRFPPSPTLMRQLPCMYSAPQVGDSLVIAVRFWVSPLVSHVETVGSGGILGTRQTVANERTRALQATLVSETPNSMVFGFGFLLSGYVFVLYFLQRDHTEYFFLAVALATLFFNMALHDWRELAPLPLLIGDYLNAAISVIGAMCIIEFVFRFIRLRMSLWFRIYQLSLPLFVVAIGAFWAGWAASAVVNLAILTFLVPYWFVTPGFLAWQYLRGNKEAGLLAIPMLLTNLDDVLGTLGWTLWELHLRSSPDPFLKTLHLGMVPVEPGTIFALLFFISIAALILYRFQKTRTEQARASAELEAARSMQEVMVPTSVAATGFHIESAYLPAQEVGGDFFQLFPADDGSLLVVIGDVSGKGLKAAMLVSLILGVLRRILKDTREPAKILNELNELLAGQTDGRFATCCCALLVSDGRLLVSNAGHLSPYCDGVELSVPGGLPIGLATNVQYEQVVLHVPAGKRLVFLSDGVVEARSKTGELYGFERTRTISIEPVKQIAATAQRFGQEDDITVLGIERQGVAFA